LLHRALREHLDDHCQQLAAAIAYHLLFSLFPLAIAAAGILGLVTSDPARRNTVINAMLDHVPLNDNGRSQLHDLLTSVNGRAGALGLIGFIGVLYSASGVMAALRTGLNQAWDAKASRPFARGKLVDLALVAASFPALAIVVVVTLLAHLASRGSHHLPHPLDLLTAPAADVLATAASGAVAFAVFVLLYRYVPTTGPRLREVWPGALVAATGFEMLQYGFSAYLGNFANYNRVYGSLGAVIAALFFVYLNASVFLFGAEVASEYPRLPTRATQPERTMFRPSVADQRYATRES
jgi:membrane protein